MITIYIKKNVKIVRNKIGVKIKIQNLTDKIKKP